MDNTTASDTPVSRASRLTVAAQFLLLVTVLLAPLFFTTSPYISFQFSKIILLLVGVGGATILFLIEVLRQGRVSVPSHYSALAFFAVPLAVFISAMVHSPRWLGLIGYGFGVDTAAFILLVFVLFYLTILLFRSEKRLQYPYIFFFVSFVILAVFHISRFFFGGLILGTYFPNALSNTVGSWNNVSVFFGLALLLSAVTLDLLKQVSVLIKTLLYICLALAAYLVLMMGFSTGFLVLGVVMLGFVLFRYATDRHNVAKHSLVAGLVLIALIIPFIPATNNFQSVGTYISDYSGAHYGIGNTDVRPSWSGTASIIKQTLKQNIIFGSGPNTFTYDWAQYRNVNINASPYWNTEFNYGVGLIPSYVATSGILGLVAWFVFLAFILYAGVRALYFKYENSFAQYITHSSFLVSVFLWIIAVVYIPSLAILILTFFFTGLFVASLYRYNVLSSRTLVFSQNTKMSPLYIAVAIILLIGALLFMFEVSMKIVSAYYYQQALVAGNARNLGRSEALLTRAINISENDLYYRTYAQLQLATISNVAGDTTQPQTVVQKQIKDSFLKAKVSNTRAITLNPRNYLNYLNLAQLYVAFIPAEGASDQAITNLKKAQTYNPKNPSLVLEEARIQNNAKNPDEAKKLVNTALSLKPDYIDAIFLLAQIQVAEGNTDKAIASVEQAIASNPNSPLLYFELGLLHYSTQNYTAARDAFGNALQRNSSYANAAYFYGLSLYQTEDTDGAVKQFDALATAFPDNTEVALILKNLKAGNDPFVGAEPPVTTAPEDRQTPPVSDGDAEATEQVTTPGITNDGQ